APDADIQAVAVAAIKDVNAAKAGAVSSLAALGSLSLSEVATAVSSLAPSAGHSRTSSRCGLHGSIDAPPVSPPAAAATTASSTTGDEAEVGADAGFDGDAGDFDTERKRGCSGQLVMAGDFEQANHFYPRVLNAQIHPLVSSFFQLGNERIIARYVHLRPNVNQDKLRELLNYAPKHFAWAG
ncbi:hypothetical protein GGI02_006075, partial [Coemansia sp. RSA 2322]